jgi:hypothetical protein
LDFKAFVQNQFQFTHGTMEQVVADLGGMLNSKMPGATINSPGAIYAHAVVAEDFIVNAMIMGGTPLFISGGWAQKTGVPAPPGPQATNEWAESINMNLAPFREYAAAVYANTGKVVAEMSDAKAAEVIDTPFGSKQPRLEFLANLGVTHAWGHMGEIAALKGVKGLKGLPF